MAKRIDYTLILPCYNEASHFRESVSEIFSVLTLSRYTFEILFIDDGSSDGTRSLIRAFCRRHPECRFLFHETNQGRGAAVMTGIRAATADIVGYMDIDCEVSPIYVPSCIRVVKEHVAEVVVGKRIYRTRPSSIIREILSQGYRFLADRMLDTGGVDTESGYKFFDKRAFLPVLPTITNRGWFWDTQSIVQSRRMGLKVSEVPVLFLRRQEKPSSVHIIRDTLEYIAALISYRTELDANRPVRTHSARVGRVRKTV